VGSGLSSKTGPMERAGGSRPEIDDATRPLSQDRDANIVGRDVSGSTGKIDLASLQSTGRKHQIMNSFVIRSALGLSSIEFFERTPSDSRVPVERFKVRLTDHELAAVGRVYVSRDDPNPATLFAQMAANWRGWQGSFVWESPSELVMRCCQDRSGHVSIRVELTSGPAQGDWSVVATVMTEAGQLEELAHEAALFFERSA
jgi:hypothetical protein